VPKNNHDMFLRYSKFERSLLVYFLDRNIPPN